MLNRSFEPLRRACRRSLLLRTVDRGNLSALLESSGSEVRCSGKTCSRMFAGSSGSLPLPVLLRVLLLPLPQLAR